MILLVLLLINFKCSNVVILVRTEWVSGLVLDEILVVPCLELILIIVATYGFEFMVWVSYRTDLGIFGV